MSEKTKYLVTERYYDNGRVEADFKPWDGVKPKACDQTKDCDIYRTVVCCKKEAQATVNRARAA